MGRSDRAGAPRRDQLLASRVVGRGREVAALRDLLEATARGEGGVAVLAGEAGIGKSRLTQVAADLAHERGLAVLSGRAVPAATPLAYRPLAEALCSAVRSGIVAESAPGLTPFRGVLGALVPEWRTADARPDDAVLALAEAVVRFLRVAAGSSGCLLVLEDLHWADPESLRIVEYLADNLVTERVLCLATVRDEERTAGRDLARALEARRVAPVLTLPRLDRDEVADLVASCLGTPAASDDVVEIAARADGVPFLVEELLASAVSTGALTADGTTWARSSVDVHAVPASVADGVRRRLRALGEPSRSVVLAAAILGRRFDWDLLPSIAEVAEGEVLTALRAAVDAHLVAVDAASGSFRFRHALSRDAVVTDLLPPERAALSRRALEVLETAHPGLEDDRCALAARLAEVAGERSRAGELLLLVGRRSLQRGALASAEAALERARGLLADDHPALGDVEESLAEVLALAGKRDRAVEVGTSLLARLEGEPAASGRRAALQLRLARAALAATDPEEASARLDRARDELATTPDPRLEARLQVTSAQLAVTHDPDGAAALATAALATAESLELPDIACEALEVLGREARARDPAAAGSAFARALAVAEANGLTVWRARALHELGTLDMLRGDTVTRLEQARGLAAAQGALATAAVVDVQIAAALVLRDDPEPAAEATRRSVALARRFGLDQTLAAALALEAHVHARAARPGDMRRCADEALALTPGAPDVVGKTAFAAAVLALLEEDRAAVRRHLTEAVDAARRGSGGDHKAVPTAGLLALVRQVDADDDADGDAPQRSPAPVHFLARAFHDYAVAVAAGRRGDEIGAADAVAQGDAALGDHRWFRGVGRRLLAEAALADGWGEPVPWLREALAFFDRRGEAQLASACRSLLRQAGAAVPRRRDGDDVPGPLRAAGVTSRELEVLRLLARGTTTKAIAARLYLSPRTVERHVANVAAKVGVAGRSELVAFAARTLGDDVPTA